MSPLRLFRRVAVAEVITWSLLLIGLFLKYVTKTTDLMVTVGGMLHGVAFVSYCVVSVLVWVDQKWTFKQLVLAILSAIPPFLTIWFERWIERKGGLGTQWRLLEQEPKNLPEKAGALLIRRPVRGLLLGVVLVALLTTVALIIGPPIPSA